MNKLFKYIIVIVLVFAGHEVFSQPPASFRSGGLTPSKKLNAIRDSYIDRQLDLTDEQKAKFWPLYRRYNQEITEVRSLKRQNLIENKSKDQMEKDIEFGQQILDIKKRYNQEFLKVIPADKVNKMYRSEREFTDEMIKRLGETPDK